MVMRDVACAGYVAGGNTRWFAKNENAAGYSLSTAANSIMSRLSFDDDVTDKYDSMLAFPAHDGQFTSGQLDTVMSVTTRILPWEVTGSSSAHDSFPGGDSMYKEYAPKLQLAQVHYGEDMKAAGMQHRLKPYPLATPADRPPACVPLQRTRISSPRDLPTYAQATQPTCPARSLLTRALPSPVTRTQPASLAPTASTTPSPRPSCRSRRARATYAAAGTTRAHPPCACRSPLPASRAQFGPDAIPGDARWRRGESVSLKTARDSMTSLELAQHAQMVYSGR